MERRDDVFGHNLPEKSDDLNLQIPLTRAVDIYLDAYHLFTYY